MPLLLAVICFHPLVARAYRPFVTEDAGVADRGAVELEASWDTIRWSSENWEHAMLFVPIVGLGWNTELSLEIPVLFNDFDGASAHSGIGDVNVVGKLNFLRERPGLPALTFKAVLKTSSGDTDRFLGSGDTHLSLVGAASKQIGQFTLHGMFGYTLVGNHGHSDSCDILLFGAGADYALTQRLHLVTEVTGNRYLKRSEDDHPIAALAGLTYALSERVVWDFGARFGLNRTAPAWNVTTGFSIKVF